MDEIARQRALDYLAEHTVATLATCGEDGVWAAAVFYVNDGFDLLFLSADHTRHARHIAANRQVAATIQENYNRWEAIQGIQMAGRAEKLSGAAQEQAMARYLEKYPFIRDNPLLSGALEKVGWYRLSAETLFFIDNTRAFGHRDRVV
jgi:uncharacterized protein YhbP (UPF0306 family)